MQASGVPSASGARKSGGTEEVGMDGAVGRGPGNSSWSFEGKKASGPSLDVLLQTLSPHGFTPCGGSAVGETELFMGRVRTPQWLAADQG